MCHTLEAELPIKWVPVLKSLYNSIFSVAQGPTIWVPGLLGTVNLFQKQEVWVPIRNQTSVLNPKPEY